MFNRNSVSEIFGVAVFANGTGEWDTQHDARTSCSFSVTSLFLVRPHKRDGHLFWTLKLGNLAHSHGQGYKDKRAHEGNTFVRQVPIFYAVGSRTSPSIPVAPDSL